MTKRMDVGRSWRTVAKHDLMSGLVGQELGVINKSPRHRSFRRLVWIDLSAGDAAPVDNETWTDACSPGILAKYAAMSDKPVIVTLHEIQPATYDRLITNLEEYLPSLGYSRGADNVWCHGDGNVHLYAINATGQEARVDFVQKTDAVLTLNDPNAITDWAMRPTFAQELADKTWCSRSLSTMGCNPAGIKRLDAAERMQWFGHVRSEESSLPAHRDLLLTAIERDDAQWAYLLCTAEKWREQTGKAVEAAFKKTGRTVELAWRRTDPMLFQQTKRRLFLTKKELEEGLL